MHNLLGSYRRCFTATMWTSVHLCELCDAHSRGQRSVPNVSLQSIVKDCPAALAKPSSPLGTVAQFRGQHDIGPCEHCVVTSHQRQHSTQHVVLVSTLSTSCMLDQACCLM